MTPSSSSSPAEADVRRRIGVALGSASLAGPDGVTSRWRLRTETASRPRPDEAEHAGRLVAHTAG
ncbi:hypothetical protein [Jiangella asiatica]|uniref:Uncharacterized protein n=1 Tax=Jiangella asiatica TaxID=2530372 RepID=A0A4R5CXC9_9ACTN|nr:hypothetical protein [Jiangella asiatica]TDE02575.1 hypothetical protein E1269_21570 [Jiangella asiatica]